MIKISTPLIYGLAFMKINFEVAPLREMNPSDENTKVVAWRCFYIWKDGNVKDLITVNQRNCDI